MKAAIPRIERRIKDLVDFDPTTVRERGDPRVDSLSSKLETLITDIFGYETIEYDRYVYRAKHLDTAGYNTLYATPIHEVIEGLNEGKATALQTLKEIVDHFQEAIADAGGSPATRAIKAYEGLELHPDVARAASRLYQDGHYALAVESAVKALNGLVRLKSGKGLDGTQLMETVFSANNPVIKFNALADQSDRDEQKGFMWLFSGAVMGLRNPRAHKFVQDDPERALEFIAFISLLAKLVDDASR
jgi:uncharacterized protein (TIGR02391 family)